MENISVIRKRDLSQHRDGPSNDSRAAGGRRPPFEGGALGWLEVPSAASGHGNTVEAGALAGVEAGADAPSVQSPVLGLKSS